MNRIIGQCLFFILPVIFFPSFLIAQCTADAGNNATICQGETAQLGGSPTAVNGTGPVTYSWTGGVPAIPAVANPSVSPTTTTTYTVTLSNGNCANQTDQVTITVLPSPNASFNSAPSAPCA